jgi:hypothetical protein
MEPLGDVGHGKSRFVPFGSGDAVSPEVKLRVPISPAAARQSNAQGRRRVPWF